MKTMTFQARELKEALARVRQELGPDALILSTREVKSVFGRPMLEVTAARQAPAESAGDRPPQRTAPAEEPRLLNRTGLSPAGRADAGRPIRNDPAEDSLLERLMPLQREVRALKNQLYQVTQSAVTPSLKQEVEELRAVLRTMSANSKHNGELTSEVARLLNLGLDRSRAEAIFIRAGELGGELQGALRRAVAERVTAAGPVGVSSRVAAFIGPTGVGKTTTIAKIAARASLIDGARVALVTIDTFRVGAIDQLQRYADLMELPLHVAGTSTALRAAVQSNAGADLILVDTAGRGPRDVAQLAALRELLSSADGVEVHLCLSATTRAREQALALQSYQPLLPTRLCFTKLDEAIGLGDVLNIHETCRLPISYFGIGQKVPEDLELCSAERFAERLLSVPVREAREPAVGHAKSPGGNA